MVNSTEIRVYMTRENENNKSLAEKVGISSATLGRWLEKQDMPVSYWIVLKKTRTQTKKEAEYRRRNPPQADLTIHDRQTTPAKQKKEATP